MQLDGSSLLARGTVARVVSAIIFDCDGVLVDSEVLAQEVETQLLADVGLHYDRREFNLRFMGASESAFWDGIEADGQARLGRSITAELRGPMQERVRAAFKERLAAIAGAHEAVGAVRQRKAVASSSTTKALRIKLQMVGLWDLFDPHIYSADHVTHAKPAPDLFLYAASALAAAPSACLVIEDSVNGVRAARAAGMRVWGFLGGGHHDRESGERLVHAGAERVLADWAEAGRLFTDV